MNINDIDREEAIGLLASFSPEYVSTRISSEHEFGSGMEECAEWIATVFSILRALHKEEIEELRNKWNSALATKN